MVRRGSQGGPRRRGRRGGRRRRRVVKEGQWCAELLVEAELQLSVEQQETRTSCRHI